MAVIYRINMSDLSVRAEEPDDKYKELGGRALTSAIVADDSSSCTVHATPRTSATAMNSKPSTATAAP